MWCVISHKPLFLFILIFLKILCTKVKFRSILLVNMHFIVKEKMGRYLSAKSAKLYILYKSSVCVLYLMSIFLMFVWRSLTYVWRHLCVYDVVCTLVCYLYITMGFRIRQRNETIFFRIHKHIACQRYKN